MLVHADGSQPPRLFEGGVNAASLMFAARHAWTEHKQGAVIVKEGQACLHTS